jgi:HSP20 family protein
MRVKKIADRLEAPESRHGNRLAPFIYLDAAIVAQASYADVVIVRSSVHDNVHLGGFPGMPLGRDHRFGDGKFFGGCLTKRLSKPIKKPEKIDRNHTQTGGSPMSFMSFGILEEMERMRREIDRILGENELSSWSFPFSRISFLPGRASQVYPLINISEDNNNFHVDALAPGLDPETLNVAVTGDQLVISGEKLPLPKNIKSEYIHRSERAAGQFTRSISLSAGVESDRVQANYTNGVLKIILPKVEAAKPKQIAVKVS